MTTTLAILFGALIGSVITFSFLAFIVRSVKGKADEEWRTEQREMMKRLHAFWAENNKLQAERNRILGEEK